MNANVPVPGPCPVCGDSGVCQCEGNPLKRPPEPQGPACVWYRGWECSYEPDRAHWTGEGYVAYKGGCDLDAPQAHGATWDALLDNVDDEEDET